MAHDLLTDTGSIFLQIGDENIHLVRCLLDEVFGADNFCALIPFRKTGGLRSGLLDSVFDFLLWYARDSANVKYRQLYEPKKPGAPGATQYRYVVRDSQIVEVDPAAVSGERLCTHGDTTSQGNEISNYTFLGRVFAGGFKYKNPEGLDRLALAGRLGWLGNTLRVIRYLDDFDHYPLNQSWQDTGVSGFASKKRYVVETNPDVVERCVLMTTDPGDLVLDPTCGSGTTAYVAEQWGRRWITLDTSRVALALARTRLMAARYSYYLLADSPDGVAKEGELTGTVPPSYSTEGDIKKGFVYKRVPHVTLKSIANNPDINQGIRPEEVARAIARHAETELLYDKPYEDGKRIHVTNPLTIESLSPHRVLSTDDERPRAEGEGKQDVGGAQFETMIIENLRMAGVQGTTKGQRIRFERLESHAGTWIQAAGEYQENGKTKRVAVSLGPEHGTVGPQQVKEAAKEAVQGVGYDTLIVCGFAFDPHVSEEVKRYGKLTVLAARMNPDLAMGDELLKKTGAGNLFMVFGEPDVKITKVVDGKLTVEIRGVDVYDPTTGEIRSSSTDDIACWFIDTDYNGESFFVRHAYFTGADEPYAKLQRALRAEIDEAAWRSLYSRTSRPFDAPTTGKIAIKVINHYGDEVLKVFALRVPADRVSH